MKVVLYISKVSETAFITLRIWWHERKTWNSMLGQKWLLLFKGLNFGGFDKLTVLKI